MKIKLAGLKLIFIIVLLYATPNLFGQISGIKSIPGDYPSISTAVDDLNISEVGTGGVTFNIAAGYTETLTASISITATGTVSNPIIFQKDPSTQGANPKIIAYATGTGTPATALQDGIWRLIGSDYITIDGLDLLDNNTTNPATMEYGFALYKASAADGCQNNTIRNCTITLNRSNNDAGVGPSVDGSVGINLTNATPTAATRVLVITAASGTNSKNKFYSNTIRNCNTGISLIGYAAASPFTLADNNNDVGGTSLSTGNTISDYGGGDVLSIAVAIRTLAQYDVNISYNIINSNTGVGINHPTTLKGIWVNTAASSNSTITYNTVSVKGGGTTQTITGIENVSGTTAAFNTVNINNNSIINCSYPTTTTGAFFGITNSGAPATLSISKNSFYGNTYAGSSGLVYFINNSGSATSSINIDNNNIGSVAADAITFSAANLGKQLYINNTRGAATAELSISSNNFQGINYAIPGTGTNTLILNSAATLSQAINGNLFTNVSVNTTGNLTFISNSVIVPATGTQNVNNNSISGTFTKAAGGIVTLFTSAATSIAGSVTNNNNNNFSNITVTGATIIAGWVNTDAGTSTKYIQNNTFTNWTGGTSAITAMNVNISGTINGTSGNVINNITGAGIVTGITTGAGRDNIFSNTINTLSTTGATTVIGISVTTGTLKNIYKNKIYDLQADIVGGVAYGISVAGTTKGATAANIYNNLIGDLRTPASNVADPVRGISITSVKTSSAINVYNNTINLNATSTGVLFGTSGIYHLANETSTTAKLTLRNNSVTNTSVPNGTGLTVAYRRSSSATGNYNSLSNNNLLYAGAPGVNRLVYYDGINKVQTIAAYKIKVAPADAQSVTEDITGKFLSTSGASSSFLHMDAGKRTQLESGGANIPGYTEDVDAETRQGNPGYTGTGTMPDIGADEFEGIKFRPLTGSYNVGVGQTYTSLTKADGLFSAINSVGLAGDVTINITSDLAEDGTNALFEWIEQGAGNYDLTIQPNSAVVRTISGDALAGLIRFVGIGRLTIDGSFGGVGRYLNFRNTNADGTTGTAFTFSNGAAGNTLRYCNMEAFANAANGVLLFSTSTAGGNSNNVVEYCSINGTVAGNTSNVGIYSAGTPANVNTSNIISNNSIYNYRDRGIDITATGSTAWTINNNSLYNGEISGEIDYPASTTLHSIRILGGGGYNLLNNYIGGNAALASGTPAVYASTFGAISYYGILLTATNATPASAIKGNIISNISISTAPVSTSSNAFIGIETNGSGVNIGGSSAGEGNTIGSNKTNGSITVTSTTALSTYKTTVRGISCNSSGGLVIGNQVSSIDIKNIGDAAGPSTFIGIYVNNANAPSLVNNNIIGSTGAGAASNSIRVLPASTATATTLSGITIGTAVTIAVQVNGNIIQNVSHQSNTTSGNLTGITNTAGTTSVINIANNTFTLNSSSATAGTVYGIYSSSIPASITITNNTISSNNTTGTTTSFYGIYNIGATPALHITNNSFKANTTTAAAGLFYAISNSGIVSNVININSNNIGSSTSGPITFNAANSGAQIFIYNRGGTATCALSINNNNFQGINYAENGTGTNTYIQNSAVTLSQAINNNTFTNLNVQTSGTITFISNSVIVSATGTQTVSNNSITGAFTKRAGGTVTCMTSSAASATGSVINISNNNFSNINLSGATILYGLVNTDAGNSTKNIQNNTFSNWTGGTGAITVMNVNITGLDNATTGNTINNITNGAAITGIATGAGNDLIFSNTINGLNSTAASVVTGIAVTTGTTKNIYKNKIYDLQSATATGTVNGILVSGGSTVNIYNNIIGDLRTPAANAVDPVRGISVTSTVVNSNINVYYNTIYLNTTSTGANSGTSGIYHVVNATSTTASLSMINNSVTNMSTQKGTGWTVAYRRSGTSLSNYSPASNNNLWYAGVPDAGKLIFYDGTNSDQTLAAFKTRMSTRDAQSITEDISTKFLSTSGSSGVYLHMNELIPSAVVSGGVNIAGITDDFDGQVRQGNPGYSGSGYAPVIGADEIFGIENIPPNITYILLSDTTTRNNRILSGVSITDGSGISSKPGAKPRIYYKRLTDANTFLDNTSATNGWKFNETGGSSTPYSFTIDYNKLYGGSSVTVGAILYFVVAQDLATIANIAINSGTFNVAPVSVALTSTAFPVTGTVNSYNIPFSGNYNVGVGNVFTSLTKTDGLFSVINSVGLMGNVTISVTSDLSEDGTTALANWAEKGTGNYTLAIKPDGTTLRTVLGNAPSGLIRLNGAGRVTIDGSNSGSGNYLSFSNTNTVGTTGTALTFINGATNNKIRYCNFEAFTDANNGVIFFSATTGFGNSNNLIEYNNIKGTVGVNNSSTTIYSAGTSGNENVLNTISNNSIFNFLYRGLDIAVTGSSAWTINNNSFYNGDVSTPVNYDASSSIHAVRILGGTGYTINNNYIGGNAALALGTEAAYNSSLGNVSFYGISLTTNSATPASNIKGNTLSKIVVTPIPTSANSAVFTGIETVGFGINIGGSLAGEGNLIGSNTINGAITVTTTTATLSNTSVVRGISCTSAGGTVTGNQVGGIDIKNNGSAPAPSTFNGIYINNASAPSQINNNIIGSAGAGAIANNIRVRTTSTADNTFLTGISIGNTTGSAIQIKNNIIQNIGPRSLTASGSFTGIDNEATSSSAVLTISNNAIKNIVTLANNSNSPAIFSGIVSATPSTITNNVIDNISLDASSGNAQIIGINVSGAFVHTLSSNTISNLTSASQKTNEIETANSANSTIVGILNSATVPGQVLSNNTISNLAVNTTAAVNTVVAGISITATASGNIFRNRLYGFTNTATGSNPGIAGIITNGGSFNVYNNAINLDNLTNTNGVAIYGILHNTGTLNWNYFHNTVKIGGSAVGNGLRTAAFIRTSKGELYLRNNIFINTRSGTGTHYAISNSIASPSLNWTSSTSDYNNIYSSVTTTVGEWGTGNSTTFAQWQTASGNGTNSLSSSVTFISSVADLEPETISNCALNNTGLPVTLPVVINTDINGNARSAATPDMGAYEFSYIPFEITADNGSPVCSGSTVDLDSDPGDAINPTFSWTSPASVVVATSQNPSVAASTGQYSVTVTDENGCYVTAQTMVILNSRPTASITGPATVCEGTSVTMNIAVTGSGLISGTLNSGEMFSGVGPLIKVTVSPNDTTAYFITDMSDASCTSIDIDIHDTLMVAVVHGAYWTGATNTNWNVAGNWYCGSIPVATMDVTIPRNVLNYPIINAGTSAVNNILIQSGATLIVSNASLQIAGSVTNYGSLTSTNGIIEMNGSSLQEIPSGMVTGNTLKQLVVNNTAGVTLRGILNLTDVLTVSGGRLNTGGYLILKSSNLATARVEQIKSVAATPINGNVTVERYVPGRRKYRLITSSVTTSANATLIIGQENLSIWNNWQNGGNNSTANNGTFITGGTAANGFDTQTSNASLFTYDDAARKFVGFTSANGKNTKYTPLKAGIAYYMFVYGDRTKSVTTSSPDNTVLTATGKLVTGNQLYNATSAIPLSNVVDRFTLLGNPFASPIDWAKTIKTDLANTYWGWDPNLGSTGGYITVNTAGSVTLIAPFSGTTGLDQYIQSGQGFFVKTTGPSPALIIREQDKVGNFNGSAFRTNGRPTGINDISLLAVNLLYNNAGITVLADGALAAFDTEFSRGIGEEDASKIINSAEGMAILNTNELLSIDGRPMPQDKDTLFLNVAKLTKPQYTLQIFAKDLNRSNLQPYLEDTYLEAVHLLSLTDTNYILFNVNAADLASSDMNRFRIIFKSAVVLPVTFTTIKASQINRDIKIQWNIALEDGIQKYEVEHSVDGVHFIKISEISAKGNNSIGSYQWLDTNPATGSNYYRIRAIQADGKFYLSNTVIEKIAAGNAQIKIFPNPVKDERINIQLSGIEKDAYTIFLFNSSGQQITKKIVSYQDGTLKETIQLNKKLPAGIYFLKIENANASYLQKIFIE